MTTPPKSRWSSVLLGVQKSTVFACLFKKKQLVYFSDLMYSNEHSGATRGCELPVMCEHVHMHPVPANVAADRAFLGSAMSRGSNLEVHACASTRGQLSARNVLTQRSRVGILPSCTSVKPVNCGYI